MARLGALSVLHPPQARAPRVWAPKFVLEVYVWATGPRLARDRTLVRSLRESGRTIRPAAYGNQKDGKALLRILKRNNRRSGKIRAPRLGIGFGSEKH